jgi:phospholipid/cholesterol/gamma-HCH transport system ATP-binding protein
VIEVRGLRTQFGDHVVHEALDLDVYRGEILGVVGGSGTGKSVLLRTIAGLNTPAEGEVRVLGTDMRDATATRPRRDRGPLGRDVPGWGAVFVADRARECRSADEGRPEPRSGDRQSLADLKIAMVGLPAIAGDKYPSELSGGMRKRAGLARALALDPEIVFLDEPTAGLDPIGASEFDTLIKGLSRSLGLTVFLVTHDLDTLHAICDRIAVLAERKVLVTGTMQDMLSVGHPWVRSYFHGPRARAALATAETSDPKEAD